MAKQIAKETIQFLKNIKKHNDRGWFNAHKDEYLAAHENFLDFTQELISRVSKFDRSLVGLDAKDSVFRIYRDIRFSKDKSPYKPFFAATLMGKGKGCGIAGYYFHLEPGHAFLAGGVHMSEPQELKAIREEISDNGKEFLKIIRSKKFVDYFSLEGEKLLKVPQGFDKEDPMADYLKYKELVIKHPVSDKELASKNFAAYSTDIFKNMVPFNAFINEPVLHK